MRKIKLKLFKVKENRKHGLDVQPEDKSFRWLAAVLFNLFLQSEDDDGGVKWKNN